MTDSDSERDLQFVNLMERACRAFQTKPLDKATFDLYHGALRNVPIETIAERLDAHIKTERFFPRVADLRPQRQATYAGGYYVKPDPIPTGQAIGNLALLKIVVAVGGLSRPKMQEMILTKQVEGEEYDEERGARDHQYQREFKANMERELIDQLKV